MSNCTTELYLSVDKLKKEKTNNKEDSGREETVLVSVQMSMSV